MEYLTILALIKWDSLSDDTHKLLTSLMNTGDATIEITPSQFTEILKTIKKG